MAARNPGGGRKVPWVSLASRAQSPGHSEPPTGRILAVVLARFALLSVPSIDRITKKHRSRGAAFVCCSRDVGHTRLNNSPHGGHHD
jgi:hypothetical protein